MAVQKAEQLINKISEALFHLLHYGELSPAEVARLKVDEAMTFLEQDGWLVQQSGDWVVTGQWLARLPVANPTELVRHICFSHPGYRRYLIALTAAEITRRGLEGAMSQVEQWLVEALPHLAGEINQLLDRLERDHLAKPLKHCAPGEVLPGFQAILAELEAQAGLEVAVWDKALLGVSGNQEAVFQAILARQALAPVSPNPAIAPLVTPARAIGALNDDLTQPQDRPVFFLLLDQLAETETGLALTDGPLWAHRNYIYSGLPLPGCSQIAPPAEDEFAWQEAFSQHPLSWLLIQLGIYQHVQRAFGGGLAHLRLTGVMGEARTLTDLQISLDEQPVGTFLALLPELMAVLGWRLVLPFGQVPPSALDRLLALMRQARIFTETPQSDYMLAESFTRTLFERPRYQQLNKGVKRYRERLIQKLEDILTRKMKRRENFADANL
ncbi:MAG: hypothetical protein BroJett011_07550 [Chloroflexota bacterium]|nr:MAG: hypothetical protein BroJett011_07550 [Chloroflexota bacterium]